MTSTNDMNEALGTAMELVLETMFFTVPDGEVNLDQQPLPVHHHVGMTFTGAYWGNFELRITPQSARAIAENFTGAMDPEELPEEKVMEVVAELTNMICGSTLSHWASDKIFSLSSPHWIATPDTPVDQRPDADPNKPEAVFHGHRALDLGGGMLAAEIEVHESAA
jgi:CheY-specific phosphatase CheX